MKSHARLLFLPTLCLLLFSCSEADFAGFTSKNAQTVTTAKSNTKQHPKFIRMEEIYNQTSRLNPLQKKMPPVKYKEWRYFWKEKEQTPQQYAGSFPVTLENNRRMLLLRRVGNFSSFEESAFRQTADFLSLYFQCPVRIGRDITVNDFPETAQKNDPKDGLTINSVYLTDKILKPGLPADCWGVMAISANNIYKAEGLSVQYGDTLIYGRAGVISIYHMKSADPQTYLMRILKGASHETAHLLSIPHCTTWLCNMNGKANMQEFDRSPLYMAPDCLAKLIFATNANINRRMTELENFATSNNLAPDYLNYCQQANALLQK